MTVLEEQKLDRAIAFVLKRIDENLEQFTEKFPSPDSRNYVYREFPNYLWRQIT